MKLISYRNELFVLVKTLVPLIGIFAFDWSIGSLFLYFCLDVLFVGGLTTLKIVTAMSSSFGARLGTLLRFVLIFSVLCIFLLVAMGHSFDGGAAGNMKAHYDHEILYSLIFVYLIDYLVGFIFSGEYKTISAKQAEKQTYYLLGLIFLILVAVMLILKTVTHAGQVNYVLAISIILSRQLAEYVLQRKWKAHQK